MEACRGKKKGGCGAIDPIEKGITHIRIAA